MLILVLCVFVWEKSTCLLSMHTSKMNDFESLIPYVRGEEMYRLDRGKPTYFQPIENRVQKFCYSHCEFHSLLQFYGIFQSRNFHFNKHTEKCSMIIHCGIFHFICSICNTFSTLKHLHHSKSSLETKTCCHWFLRKKNEFLSATFE